MTQLFEKTGMNLVFAMPPAARLQLGQATGHTNQTIMQQNDNLFDAQKAPDTLANVALSNVVVGGFTATGTSATTYCNAQWIKYLTPGSTYHLKFTSTADLEEGGKASVYGTSGFLAGNSKDFSFTVPSDGYIKIEFFANQATSGIYSATFSQIMLNLGSTATAYEPFVPDSPSPDYQAPMTGVTKVTVNGVDYALPQTMYSLPDGTADSYDLVSGSGTQKSKEYISNGAESNWIFVNVTAHSSTAYFANNLIFTDAKYVDDATVFNAICSHFASKSPGNLWNGDVEGITHDAAYFYISILKSRLAGWSDSWTNTQKVDAFKIWLQSNPVTILYELAVSQTITGTAVGPITLPAGQVNVTTDGDGTVSLSVYNEWTDPKTDWNADDYFNLDPDYVRIKENIEYIKEFSEAMYDEFSIAEMGDFTIDGFPFDTFLNNIVDNVTALEENLFKPPQDQDMNRYVGGGNGWDYKQLNIIESNLLRLKNAMQSQWNCIPQMAFSMGTGVDEF